MEIQGGWGRVAESNELQLPQALSGMLIEFPPPFNPTLALAQKTLRREEGVGTG